MPDPTITLPIAQENKVILINEQNTHDDNGEIKHRYYMTTWNHISPPYCQVAVYLDSFNKQSKKFRLVVLNDIAKRVLEVIPVGYPLIPISEEEAQILVNHRLNSIRSKNSSPQQQLKEIMQLSNLNVATAPAAAEHKTHAAEKQVEAAPAEASTSAPETKEKKVRVRIAKDGRPSIRKLVLAGIAEGKSKEELIPILQSVYPERDEPNIKLLINLYIGLKKKNEKAPAVAAAA